MGVQPIGQSCLRIGFDHRLENLNHSSARRNDWQFSDLDVAPRTTISSAPVFFVVDAHTTTT
jgi:hypothetical protein